MSFLNNILKTFVGDKTKKDLSKITPLIAQINKHQKDFESLPHDALRQKTEDFKQQITSARSSFDTTIEQLKKEVKETNDIDAKESLYQQIDSQDEEAQKTVEDLLNTILPEAFAVVKETARRFVENTTIAVTASAYDRELSQNKDYVQLKEDKAYWANSWDAAGKPITWDMIHYDVQLIGGIALHQGKIAEMQTGEGKTLVATLPVYLNALTGKGVPLSNG